MLELSVLKQRQSLPLEAKIAMTELRLREFVNKFGVDGVYVSFSGGKDSTVLLDIARKKYKSIKAMFVDTGLEFPEIRDFVKSYENVDVIKPEMNFKCVLEKYGFPIISKEVSEVIYQARMSDGVKYKYRLDSLNGTRKKKNGEQAMFQQTKWKYLLDAPFKISNKCCNVMKKSPAHKYTKETGRMPILAVMADESALRTQSYLKSGCNAFEQKIPTSRPMGFWTEQDVLRYVKTNDLKVASVYGELQEYDGNLRFSGMQRTGCMFCGFGVHLEKEPNRFQVMQKTHPKQWDYIMHKLGMAEVLRYIKVPYEYNFLF